MPGSSFRWFMCTFPTARKAFTLIELLVVITIIVVLLALLTPALDKAIYQTEILICGTNQRLIASGVSTYAFENKRTYPHRDLSEDPLVHYGIQAHKLANPYDDGSGVGTYDIRPMLRPYMPINKTFNDVFCEPVDLDKDDLDGGASETTHVYASLFLWAGWKYAGFGGMKKVGDRFTADVNEDGRMVRRSFNLLVGDIDAREGQAYVSHPDNLYLTSVVYQDYPFPFGGLITTSIWNRADSAERGDAVDFNFAYGDLSVRRMDRVEFIWGRPDERSALIPNFNDTNGQPGWNQVPRR